MRERERERERKNINGNLLDLWGLWKIFYCPTLISFVYNGIKNSEQKKLYIPE